MFYTLQNFLYCWLFDEQLENMKSETYKDGKNLEMKKINELKNVF